MNKFLYPSDKEVNIACISYIIFGLIICIFNVRILISAIRIIGIIIIMLATYLLYAFFAKRNTNSNLFSGMLSILFGILMASSPETILSILPVLIGSILIINAIIHLKKSLILKDNGYKKWSVSMCISLIILVIGLILFFKPIQSLSFILQIMGIALIIDAIFMLINQHIMKNYY